MTSMQMLPSEGTYYKSKGLFAGRTIYIKTVQFITRSKKLYKVPSTKLYKG